MIFARSFAQTLSARSYNRYLEIWRRNSLQMITNRLIEFDLAFEMTAAGHIQTTNSIDALRRLMNQLQRKELTSMRMTVTAHDGDITRFPEIQVDGMWWGWAGVGGGGGSRGGRMDYLRFTEGAVSHTAPKESKKILSGQKMAGKKTFFVSLSTRR